MQVVRKGMYVRYRTKNVRCGPVRRSQCLSVLTDIRTCTHRTVLSSKDALGGSSLPIFLRRRTALQAVEEDWSDNQTGNKQSICWCFLRITHTHMCTILTFWFLTMKVSSLTLGTFGALLSQCYGFSPITSLHRSSTVVQDMIRSQWTMMPDEPTPEVRTWCSTCWQ